MNDRIFVSTSSMQHSVNIAWAAASSGIFSRDEQPDYDGELLVHEEEGLATMKWWDGDEPFVLVVDPKRKNGAYVTVYSSEDQPPAPDATVVWSSASERAEAQA